MTDYWKQYWHRHVESVASDDPFRQVLRVLNKQPQTDEQFNKISADIINKLELQSDHLVLDLCCGNGLLSARVAEQCQSVVGVDFCGRLVADIRLRGRENIVGVIGDATSVSFRPQAFHRALLAAALQHLSQAEVIRLLNQLSVWLKPGGILLITDILDSQRIWNFYNSREREADYFRGIRENRPILGTWFDRAWLEKAARHEGFTHAEALDQPEDFWYSHYRFDLKCYN